MKLYNVIDSKYIIAEDTQNKLYILKDGKDFYLLKSRQVTNIIGRNRLIFQKEINDNIFLPIIMLITIILTVVLYLQTRTYTIIDKNFAIATILLIINIPIHELGHIACLKLFSSNSKITIGFKIVFIYPAVFVDTSDSYLLPKYKKIAIYLAGNFMNCLFLITIYFFFPVLLPYCYLIISNIFINFLPIIKSDGYYAYQTLKNNFQMEKSFTYSTIEDFIRGFLLFLFLEFISYIF